MTWDTQPRGIDGLSRLSGADGAFVTATDSNEPRTLADRFGEVVNVKDYGASPSQTASFNAGALQDAITEAVDRVSATIVIPSGEYDFNTGLVQAPASGQTHINWLGLGGAGSNGVILNYTGSGGTALTIKNNTRYQVDNLRLIDSGTGAIGLHLTSIDVGSNHGPAKYTNNYIYGFNTGIQIGTSDNRAASEILFENLETSSATIGVYVIGPASGTSFTTNIRFLAHQAVSCGDVIVVDGDNTGTQIKLTIWGFSYSLNTREWDFRVPGVYDISSGYTESNTDGQLFRCGSATPTLNSAYVNKLSIRSVVCNYPSSPSNFIALAYQPGHYLIENSTIQTGRIELGGFDGGGGARKSTIDIRNSTVVRSGDPLVYRAGSNTVWSVSYRRTGNTNTEAVNQDIERDYIINTAGAEFNLNKFDWSASAALVGAAGTYTAADTTPSVVGLNAENYMTITNGGGVSITTFDDGYDGQIINLFFTDGNTTLVDGATLQLAGGTNFVGSANDTITLQKVSTTWIEKSRSVN